MFDLRDGVGMSDYKYHQSFRSSGKIRHRYSTVRRSGLIDVVIESFG